MTSHVRSALWTLPFFGPKTFLFRQLVITKVNIHLAKILVNLWYWFCSIFIDLQKPFNCQHVERSVIASILMTKSSLVAVATQPIFKSGVWLGKIHILRNHFESKTSKNVQKCPKTSKSIQNCLELFWDV